MSDMMNLNVRVDKHLKRNVEEIFDAIGISTTAAINMFFRQCVRYGGIPFDLRVQERNGELKQEENNS